jgi:3-dehydroquinate dehydratase/shikimate dehydrogenase
VSGLQTSIDGARSGPTLLCTPLMGTTVDQMLIEMGKAKEIGADVVEIRLDCLRKFNPRQDLEILIKRSSLPTLVTYRFGLSIIIISLFFIILSFSDKW